MPVATFKFTEDFALETLRHYWRHKHHVGWTVKLLIFVPIVLTALVLFHLGYPVLAIGFGVTGGLLFVAQQVDYWLVRRAFRQSPYRDEEVTIVFNEEKVHVRSSKQDSRLEWNVFTQAAFFRKGILFFQGPKSPLWIPFSALTRTDQADTLIALVRSKISEHKIVEAPETSPSATNKNAAAAETHP